MKKSNVFLAVAGAAFAIVGAFATQTNANAKLFATTYYEAPGCTAISCDASFTGIACKQTANLYSSQASCPTGTPVVPPSNFKRQ